MILAFAAVSSAQTPQETKLYNKTMAKPSVKAYNKFLAKFPESTYSEEIMTLRDTKLFDAIDKTDAAAVEAFAAEHSTSPIIGTVNDIITKLNTSDLDAAAALAVVKALASDASSAVGYKKSGIDYAFGVGLTDNNINLYKCTLGKDGAWTLETIPVDKYTLDQNLSSTRLIGDIEIVPMNARQLLLVNYLNSAKGSSSQEYVSSLYDVQNESFTNAMFYGKSMAGKNDDYKIEGQSPESIGGGIMMPETIYLLNRFTENPALVQIAKADALADDAIAWWLSKNPNALTKATRVTFGQLDEENALIAGYKKCSSKDKDSSASYTAALFNSRGYTVIVVYSKSDKSYSLAWAEPICKNKNTDRLLNNIYFRDANNLTLYYYKGKTTFKYELNLATKVLRR